jgi:hypothetical protein
LSRGKSEEKNTSGMKDAYSAGAFFRFVIWIKSIELRVRLSEAVGPFVQLHPVGPGESGSWLAVGAPCLSLLFGAAMHGLQLMSRQGARKLKRQDGKKAKRTIIKTRYKIFLAGAERRGEVGRRERG